MNDVLHADPAISRKVAGLLAGRSNAIVDGPLTAALLDYSLGNELFDVNTNRLAAQPASVSHVAEAWRSLANRRYSTLAAVLPSKPPVNRKQIDVALKALDGAGGDAAARQLATRIRSDLRPGGAGTAAVLQTLKATHDSLVGIVDVTPAVPVSAVARVVAVSAGPAL